MAEVHTSADAAAYSTEFFTAHVESLREALITVDLNDKEARVEAEIEASKAYWNVLTSAYGTAGEVRAVESTSTSTSEWEGRSEVETMKEWNERVAKDNVVVFRSLQARYPGGFFVDENEQEEWKLIGKKPFAEGAQAQLFHAHVVHRDGMREEGLTMKVFKEGTSLRDLQRLLPASMLNDTLMQEKGWSLIEGCNTIVGARLLKADGRFAFMMRRAWGDLRKLMDVRMIRNNNQGAPFSEEVACCCMFCVAKGMQSLHARGIVHRDLKAANVLVFNDRSNSNWADVDPFLLRANGFSCDVADFECSVGVVGTGFWRASEILLALKNRNIAQKLEIFSKQVDVYSFGMTCYEILTGRIPLEELRGSDYDGVIRGVTPILPRETPSWMTNVVERCWHRNPSIRPTFDEVVDIIRDNCKDFEPIWKKML